MLKGVVREFARRRGVEILGYPRAFAAHRSLRGLLEQEQIDLVFDVGANTGQFVDELRASGYDRRIISFEPLASAHSVLCGRANGDPLWSIAERTAIGAETGQVEIHISRNGVSSSILDMLPSHSEAEPQSSYTGTETVPVKRLDDLCVVGAADRAMLKIDVQGYERQVLQGAQRVLAGCRAVILEMSLVPLYDGQTLARQLWEVLAGAGFEAWALEPGFRHPQTGRMLQLDGVFVRSQDGPRG